MHIYVCMYKKHKKKSATTIYIMKPADHFIKIFKSPVTYAKQIPATQQYNVTYLNYAIITTFFLVLIGFLSYIEILQVRGGLRYFFNLHPFNFSPLTLTYLLIITITSYIIFAATIPFILAASTHLGVLFLTKKSGYQKTFNATTPTIPIGFAYIILAKLITTFFAILLGPGTMFQIINLFFNALLGIIATIHIFYAQTRLLQVKHDLKPTKSFASVVAIPLLSIVAGSVFSIFYVVLSLLGGITPLQNI